MKNYSKINLYIAGALVVVVLSIFVFWLVFLSGPGQTTPPSNTTQLGTGATRTPAVPGGNNGLPVISTEPSTQKVFKIAEGPIAGAVLLETTRPTSTVARFVLQDNGHVFDLVLDSPGAVPKAVSNITIPGIDRVLWTAPTGSPKGGKGRGALMQYLDVDVVKTLHTSLPPVGSTTPVARVQFLPAGISDLAVSPDGTSVAYLLRGEGTEGYTASADGSNPKRLFSLPLAQTLVSWPSPGALLVTTAPHAGVPGIAFSVDARVGSVSTLLYAPGLSVMADRLFNYILYQKVEGESSTYIYNIRTGLSTPLSLDPAPERCLWSAIATSTFYCATPLAYVPPNYLDLWHQGAQSAPDTLLSYNAASGRSTLLATPGSADGGEGSDIAEIGLSPREDYLIYIRKGDRSLWGVRLSN